MEGRWIQKGGGGWGMGPSGHDTMLSQLLSGRGHAFGHGGGGKVLLLSTTLLPAETIPRQCKTQVDNAWGQFKQVCAKS